MDVGFGDAGGGEDVLVDVAGREEMLVKAGWENEKGGLTYPKV